MSSIDLVLPGNIDTPTGGYIYDREILAGLRALRWRTAVHSLDASFPQPTPPAVRAARIGAAVHRAPIDAARRPHRRRNISR